MATVGTTAATAVDPVPAIADACAASGAWLHVDAAYAGTAMVCPEFRWAFAGVERADSLVVNAHKWMLTPMDCSLLWTSRPDDFRARVQPRPRVPAHARRRGRARLSEYGPALGRRFRALKLWAVLRCYGRRACSATSAAASSSRREFERVGRAEAAAGSCARRGTFSLVCFRLEGDDDRNRALLERVNASGEMFISHAALDGRYVLRLAVGQVSTTEDDVRRAWEVLVREAS